MDTNTGIVLALKEGLDLPLNTHYVSLSHCWGSGPVFRLTVENESSLHDTIPWKLLHFVFQDAALATLELGFSYLWIDSLCIIQNCALDWSTQSSQMGKIFKFATLNIAATGFRHGKRGLFVGRELSELLPMKVFANWQGTWLRPDRRKRRTFYYMVEDDLWTRDITCAPLNRRAWVLQERLLSPRILHFSKRQLFWECLEATFCEVFPEGIGESLALFNDDILYEYARREKVN